MRICRPQEPFINSATITVRPKYHKKQNVTRIQGTKNGSQKRPSTQRARTVQGSANRCLRLTILEPSDRLYLSHYSLTVPSNLRPTLNSIVFYSDVSYCHVSCALLNFKLSTCCQSHPYLSLLFTLVCSKPVFPVCTPRSRRVASALPSSAMGTR
jgi:hypothetical protein